MCSAVNEIDAASLEALNHRQEDAGVTLHQSEVKSPVMDRPQRSNLPEERSDRVFLARYDAWRELGRRGIPAWVDGTAWQHVQVPERDRDPTGLND